MPTAETLIQDIRASLAETEHEIRDHPYLAALDAGQVSRDALRAFPGHQYNMWEGDMRAMAHCVERFGDRPYRDYFITDLQGELSARGGIVTLGARLGMTEQDLKDYEPSAAGFAYSGYVAWLAMYGSAAEIACGLTLNLAAWGRNCGRMSQALRTHYDFAPDDTAFLDTFAELPSSDAAALEIVSDDLGRGVAPRRIARAARLIQAYEKMFWDAMAATAA